MASTYTPSHDTEPSSSSSHSSVPLTTSAHPPRLASLAGTGLTSASAAGARDNWGGLLSSDASSPSSPAIGVAVGAGAGTGGGEEAEAAIGKLKDAEEALKERKSNSSKLARELEELEARLAAAEEREQVLRAKQQL